MKYAPEHRLEAERLLEVAEVWTERYMQHEQPEFLAFAMLHGQLAQVHATLACVEDD